MERKIYLTSGHHSNSTELENIDRRALEDTSAIILQGKKMEFIDELPNEMRHFVERLKKNKGPV